MTEDGRISNTVNHNEEQDNPGDFSDLSPDEFRKYGYQVIDWIADYMENPEKYPVLSRALPGEIKAQFPEHPPQYGENMGNILEDVEKIIVPGLTHWNHPLFMAYFSITGSAPGILGELLCSAFNVNAMLWKTSPSATELEEVVLDWLRQMIGLPPQFQGIIYDSASTSSMHAIAAAREYVNLGIREKGMAGRNDLPRLCLYCSDQAHSSIEKGALAMGIGQENVRKIPVDDQFKMIPSQLALAIENDIQTGHKPFCVVATVGTTSTTSIDPVPEIADICEKHDLWLHIDGAYGGSPAVADEMRWVLNGCRRAHSILLNPHKWLFTPIDCSAFFCRRFDILKRAFSLVPEYLKTDRDDQVINYMDYGVQLGRRFRALKLWMVMRHFGQKGLAANIMKHIRIAQELASWIKEDKDFQLMAPVPYSTVCFRYNPKSLADKDEDFLENLNSKIMSRVNATGQAFISHTKLKGKFTLRIALGNIRTTREHVKNTWNLIQKTAAGLNKVE